MSTDQEQRDSRTFVDYVGLAARGFAMGSSDIVPGVSGGTMALILGIYEELITSIKGVMNREAIRLALRFKIKQALNLIPWQFLASVAIGIFAAVFTMSFFLEWVLHNYPSLLWAFFFGLVAASIPTIGRHIQTWNYVPVIGLIAGAVGAYTLVGLVPVETPETWWFFFLSGVVAISAMVLPGVSGSFMLVLLGKYERILSAVTNMEIGILLLVIAGAAVGIVSVAQILSWLFKRYHDGTIAVLAGMLLGSLRKVWPWKTVAETGLEQNVLPVQWSGEVFLVIVLALFGFALITSLSLWAARREKAET
jgi:putative membrane protein